MSSLIRHAVPRVSGTSPMTLTAEGVTQALLDALEAFDTRTLPLGLYACEEFKAKDKPFPRLYQEWHLCLKPCLKALGCSVSTNLRTDPLLFDLPDGTRAQLWIVRTSKIKVRKFGSAYRIDSPHQYSERWKELQLDRELSQLWKPSDRAQRPIGLRIFLFLGFAKEAEPFAKELEQLEKKTRFDQHEVFVQTRSWADRADRHFFIRLSAWYRTHAPADREL